MLTPARTDHENFHNSNSVEDLPIADCRLRIADLLIPRILILSPLAQDSSPTINPQSTIRNPQSAIVRPSLDSSRRRKLRLRFALPSPFSAWRPNRLNKSYQAKVGRRIQSPTLKGR